MTPGDAQEKIAEANRTSTRAIYQHNLAMQAFGIACARFDWETAQKEHELSMTHLDAYLNALMSCHKISEMLSRGED